MEMERVLAKCKDFDIQDNDHGGLMLGGYFEYEEGGCQGLGYTPDMEFIKRFMDVFRVERLQRVNGKSCWVTHSHEDIALIEPLHKKDGESFSVKEWSDNRKARCH